MAGMDYTPAPEILTRYAEVMVNYGLGNGAGVASGDVVGIVCHEDAKPLLLEAAKTIWRAGGHVIVDYTPADDADWNLNEAFYDLASDDQLDYAPVDWARTWFDTIDHYLIMGGPRDLRAGAGIDPARRARHNRAWSPIYSHRFEREKTGAMSWTGGLYATAGMAAEAGMTLQEYWEQIIHACYLDDPDPVARWRSTQAEIRATTDWINELDIDRLHLEAEDTDLWISVGEQRRWFGGSTVNIPSFEICTSPDWRGTQGHIRFSEPLYLGGAVMRGVRLGFVDGEVVEATADEGQDTLSEMVATDPGAARIGEYSLTDGRHSRITRFMAHTLYDENRGGPTGNTHLALGHSFEDLFTGDVANTTPEQFAELGFNRSSIHVDIVSTSERTVTATLRDGSERVIYAGGRFQND